MANGVTSQWEDIHIKLGNYEERPVIIEQSVLNLEAQQRIEESKDVVDYLDRKEQDELDALEDEFMDDDFFDKYKEQRMNEMKEVSKRPFFGSVLEISREQYIAEVTNAPLGVWVVLHLYQNYNEYANLLNTWLTNLAAKYPHTKFIKIIATRCTENFPDRCVPCILMYNTTQLCASINSVHTFLRKFTERNFERVLHEHSVIKCTDFEQDEEEIQDALNILKNPIKRSYQDALDKEDNRGNDDREYVNQDLKIHKNI